MADLIGPAEARLLALERLLARGESDLRGLRRGLVGLGQGVWDAWSDAAPGTAAAPATVTAFPSICPGGFPLAGSIHDSYYGTDTAIAWDGVSTWTGCTLVSYPGSLFCAGGSTAMFYTLFGDDTTATWTLRVAFVGHVVGGNTCPVVGATCGGTPTTNRNLTSTIRCPPSTSAWSASGGTSGQIWPSGAFPLLTLSWP